MTIIFDIDGTLTDMWPLERAVIAAMLGPRASKHIDALKETCQYSNLRLYRTCAHSTISAQAFRERYNRVFQSLARRRALPVLKPSPLVGWIRTNKNRFRFVYATGGQAQETWYVLKRLRILNAFEISRSIDRSSCRFCKSTGIPFLRIQRAVADECIMVTDSIADVRGAKKAVIPSILVAL